MDRKRPKTRPGDDWLFPSVGTASDVEEASLLDIVDNVLNHGVVLHGELILGVANVDLIYAKLSLLLAALDKLPFGSPKPSRRSKPSRKRK